MLDHFRTRLSRVDDRPVEQIDRDIDDELSAHLELLQHDLIESGLSPAAAREQALSRFGNPQTHKRRCREVALMERRMKTYAQIAVTAGCGLLLALVTTSLWFNQQSANASLLSMNDKMADLATAMSSHTPAPSGSVTSSKAATVYVTGDVANPGQYAMPSEGVSLRRMLTVAGVNEWDLNSVVISRKAADGPKRIPVPGTYLREDESKDVPLQADDLLTVVKHEDLSKVVKLVRSPTNRQREPRAGEMLFVMGDVRNPGQYAMPANGITLRRLLAVAGVDERTVNHVVVTSSGSERNFAIPGTDMREKSQDVTLNGGELIKVVKNEDPAKTAVKPAEVVDPVEAAGAVEATNAPKR